MKKFYLCFSLLFLVSINAQDLSERQLDSLYNSFLSIRGTTDVQSIGQETEPGKCGFGIVNEIKLNLDRYPFEKQQLLKSLLQRPIKQNSMVSPSGFFRIHYNTTGNDVPRYNSSLTTEQNVEQVGLALDSTYNFEVNFLGYPEPPPDNNEGGDNKYDVYISNLGSGGSGLYGYTEFETPLGNEKYTSYMVIDDDYLGFYSAGLEGMQVTVAHELHHAIQIGNYIFRNNDLFFYEITSTSMEEFVFDDVNDYYAYMPAYFNNTSISFSNTDGYELAIWNIFLKDRFDFDIIKKQWELMRGDNNSPPKRALDAINTSILERGSNFKTEFSTFGLWTYFTDRRFEEGIKQGFAFKEGSEYPLVRTLPPQNFTPPEKILNLSSYPVSNNFLTVANNLDTLSIVITNSDVSAGLSNPNSQSEFGYSIFDYHADGSNLITGSYFYKTTSENPPIWRTAHVLNNTVISEGIIADKDIDFPFPSPFFYGRIYQHGEVISFPVKNPQDANVNFNVYTSGMELVYSGTMQLEPFGAFNYVVKWDARDNKKNKLASGVYIYVIKSGDETSKGKLVIFNE